MQILFAVGLAIAQLQGAAIDVPSIVRIALDRVVPSAPPPARSFGQVPLGARTLFLDTARTTMAFRALGAVPPTDYGKLGRAFVVRSRDDAVRCDPVKKLECSIVDGGIYATITSVERGSVAGRYVIKLRVFWTGETMLQGFEQAMIVSKHAGSGWKVDSLGTARVLN